ncbi:MAG: NUDIX domain-containing protein [Atopobiaceae bacterium]|nr:NUDIX domain-containing protein [Atopobiaceae bacterium]
MNNNEMPAVSKPHVNEIAGTPYLRLYDLAYDDGTHYYEASRRKLDDLLVGKDEAERAQTLPDAVSCCLVLETRGREPRMVLFHEYRYPTGQALLSVPSGLIDERDRQEEEPLVAAMTREVGEECGLHMRAGDRMWVINPFLFNTPGMTDESTALLCAVVRRGDEGELSQEGAEGTERFEGFDLLTKAEVQQVLSRGTDQYGHYYPMVAWAAMTYFATDQWQRS